MLNEKQLAKDVTEATVMEELTRAYAQIASTKMRESRERVLSNREFISAIGDIFQEVRSSYAIEFKRILARKGLSFNEKITLLSHNGRTVCVFLSANTGLYGDIVQRTFDIFSDEVIKNDYEVTIVGKLGLALFKESFPKRPYTYFDLPDTNASAYDLAELISHVVRYEQIHLYYGKFDTVISQNPIVYNITSELPHVEEDSLKKRKSYLFEPSMEKILMFFEGEIFASLFDQSVRENELSKYASRMLAMDRASENIKHYLKETTLTRLRLVHMSSNKKQTNSMSSLVGIY